LSIINQDKNNKVLTQDKQKPRLFYGWIIVIATAVIGSVTPSLAMLNFGLFIKVMGDELGIGRSMFGWAQTARQVAGSISGPVLGKMVDRFGSRVMLAIAVVVTGAGMIGLSYVFHSWQMILMFGFMGIIGVGGPGGSIITSIPIFKWFLRNRGKAIAYTAIGAPIGAIIFIPLTQILISSVGWRQAWIILAIIGVTVVLPLSLIFIRRQPEDMGLYPDGISPAKENSINPDSNIIFHDEVSWTVQEAIHSKAFWQLVVAFSLMSLATGSIGLHRIPAFMDRGLDPKLVSYATAFDACMAGTSTFISGLLVRRFSARFISIAGFCFLGAATIFTIHAYTFPVMFMSVVMFGLGIGCQMFAANFLWAEYYGRQNLGSIMGVVAPITMIVGGIGPPLAGYVHDAIGRYDPMWWVSVGLIAISVVILFTTRTPKKAAITV
jgi:MFS family permease